MITSRRVLAVALVAAALLPAAGHAAPAPRLGPIVRVTTPGTAACHAEGETAVAITAAGTWVGYNDLGLCQAPNYVLGQRVTGLQLLPTGGGPAKLIELSPLETRAGYWGDPALAPDVDGRGVVLATLAGTSDPEVGVNSGSSATIRLEVLRVSGTGVATRLPAVSGPKPSDDKEAVAVDRGPRSPRRGWVYLVWDDVDASEVILRAFDGRRWLPRVVVEPAPGGRPDVAVSPTGAVAVAYETGGGVQVRVAMDPRKPLAPAVPAITGADPGHVDPSCPLINAVGVRQRVIRSPRLAWGTDGTLHLVASIGKGLNVTPPAAASTAEATVVHAVSSDGGATWKVQPITERSAWAPSIAALPGGEVAVGYLELADSTGRTATAHIWRSRHGSVEVSAGAAALSVGSETTMSNYCYGMGDYTGIAARGGDVAYAWPSTAGAAAPGYDTDVLVRHLFT